MSRSAGSLARDSEAHAIGVLCYGALAGGFLSERWLGVPEPASDPLENRSLVKYRLIIDEFGGWPLFQRLLRVLRGIGARHGAGIGSVAMRWVLDQPAVAGVIVGVRHDGHLASVASAQALQLDDEDRAAIAAVQSKAVGPHGEVYGLERIKSGRHASVMRYTLNRPE